jgi:hypothetical protein
MPILLHDYETRSVLNIEDVGAWRYSKEELTDVWGCAYAVDDGPIEWWAPSDPTPEPFIEAARNPDWITCAFNDQFERLITKHIMGPRYGWPLVPIERRRCLQAAALALALPATMEKIALALDLEPKKDAAGWHIMLAMSRKRKPRKGEDPNGIYWDDDPEHLEILKEYCRTDVAVERALHHRIGVLPEAEQRLWELDSVINDRGFYPDLHGASTGRWSSLGIQVQNFKRPDDIDDIGAAIDLVRTGDVAAVRRVYASPIQVVGNIVRGAIAAAPGHELISGDFSGVESRVGAWLSGEQRKIEQWAKFDQTQDPEDEPYLINGLAFGLAKEIARGPGKTSDLAFLYGGSIPAWRNLAPDDNSSDEVILARLDTWRAKHPMTVRFWGMLDIATIRAVHKPGTIQHCGCLAFKVEGDFLKMRLPSGHKIAYPFPKLITNSRGYPAVSFMDNEKGKWVECRGGEGSYHGVWMENAVSAIARDLFAAAMPRLEQAGYPIVVHVHDEICAEIPIGFGSVEEYQRLLIELPDWAAGLPLSAKVRRGPRFCKLGPRKTAVLAPAEPVAAIGEQSDPEPPTDGACACIQCGAEIAAGEAPLIS